MDDKKVRSSQLKSRVEKLLDILKEDPFSTYPPYEKLVGDLGGTYSRKINI